MNPHHWERIYRTRGECDVSWFEALPAVSIEMLEAAGLTSETCVVDVGGGESRLVDALLAKGLECLAVLDISGEALNHARARIGAPAQVVTWIQADVTSAWSLKPMDIWHDRAVFHFLTERDERARYVGHLLHTLKPGGSAIIATFAPDGPETCSGLPVARYSAEALAAELGNQFVLEDARAHQHRTPSGSLQPFTYTRFTRTSRPPIVSSKHTTEPSVFTPMNVLSESRRQKGLAALHVPPVCVLDPDGDIVRALKRQGRATLSKTWACYHSELYEFGVEDQRVGIVGCAVGAPYAVLVAEQMFACGCEILISITSSGQIAKVAEPPYFVLVTHALRDEGTSYHYQPESRYSVADPALLRAARKALNEVGFLLIDGATWTTDAPYRETASAVTSAEREGILAVEMESAALYAFAAARQRNVLCVAHVTNTLGRSTAEFDKGEDDGVAASLRLVEALVLAGVGRNSA